MGPAPKGIFLLIAVLGVCGARPAMAQGFCVSNDVGRPDDALVVTQGRHKTLLRASNIPQCCRNDCSGPVTISFRSHSRLVRDRTICTVRPQSGDQIFVYGEPGAWGCELSDSHGLYKNTYYLRNTRPRLNTHVQVCNRAGDGVAAVAYAYQGGRGDWISVGWANAAPGGCVELRLRRHYRGDVYVYAKATRITWDGDDAHFCVDQGDGFKFSNTNRAGCEEGGRQVQVVGMFRVPVNPDRLKTVTLSP